MVDVYAKKILDAYKAGNINKFMFKKLIGVISSGVSDSLCDELLVDARDASTAGVHSEEDYNAYFFAGNFVDEILDDTFGMKVSPDHKKDICKHIMSSRGEDYALDSLVDYRILIHEWLTSRLSKNAHPNIGGSNPDREKEYDMDKWVSALKKIYSSLRVNDISREDAIVKYTAKWDEAEKHNFLAWVRYFEEGTPEKYNIKTAYLKKEALDIAMPPLPAAWQSRLTDSRPSISTHKKPEQTAKERNMGNAKLLKLKMRSRLRALKRLIEKYNDALSHQNVDNVYDEMYTLEKSINKLDVYASIEDCIIRSANRIERMGFAEGASLLKSAAEEGVQQDEKLLESLPDQVPAAPDMQNGQPQADVEAIINRLAGLSKKLKSRDTIRELATVDILLNELGLASYFPELTDAQAKLIEAYGYASNKIESIIAKLRGSGKAESIPPPPNGGAPLAGEMPSVAPVQSPKVQKKVETGDMMGKPMGEAKRVLPEKKEIK